MFHFKTSSHFFVSSLTYRLVLAIINLSMSFCVELITFIIENFYKIPINPRNN